MPYLIIFTICTIFIAFFVQLEVRYFGLFPLLFLIFFFSQGIQDMKLKFSEVDLAEKYGLYALGLLVFFGLFGILNFIGLNNQTSFFILLFISRILWYCSYFRDYQDGKTIFKNWFLFILALLLGDHLIENGRNDFEGILSICLLLANLGFWWLRYGIGSFRDVEKDHHYHFFFFLLLLVGDILFSIISTPLYALNLDLLAYCIFLLLLNHAYQLPKEKETLKKEISLRRVLAGERILKKEKKSDFLSFFHFLQGLPKNIERLFEYSNVGLLIGILVAYLLPIFQWQVLQQRRYRSWIALFLINAFLLKKNQIFSLISRFAVALIINFSLYISLLVFGDGVKEMLPWLIARNILCGILVFYTRIPAIKAWFKKTDVIFWLLTSLVAMLLNIMLLMRLSLSGQLIFSLIFFYLWIQGTIAYYVLQLIRNYDILPTEIGNNDPLNILLEKEMKL